MFFKLTEISGQNQSQEKLIRKFLHPITIVKRLFNTWEKCFMQSEISCQNESVSSQTRSHFCCRLFNLHSFKYVEFPQDYSSFTSQTKFQQVITLDKPIKKYIQEEQSKNTQTKTRQDLRSACLANFSTEGRCKKSSK